MRPLLLNMLGQMTCNIFGVLYLEMILLTSLLLLLYNNRYKNHVLMTSDDTEWTTH